jgi:formylmethanofuran dehydrogenase subunit E
MRLAELLAMSARLHEGRLCPRQVLGVRMSLFAGRLLDLELPQRDKRLLAIVETYGCAADGVAVGAGCWVGRRTLRVVDLGKVAATYIDTLTGRAIRIHPRPAARQQAWTYAPEALDRWHAQLLGYQRMPDELLLVWQEVRLLTPVEVLLGRVGERVVCTTCGEEVLDQREVFRDGRPLCRACAGEAYYQVLMDSGWRPDQARCSQEVSEPLED